ALPISSMPFISKGLGTQLQLPSLPAVKSRSIPGINIALPASSYGSWLSQLTAQPASLNLGNKVVPISPATIKSWLKITPNANKSIYSVHVSGKLIASSLSSLIGTYVKAPVNQVVATRDDGS